MLSLLELAIGGAAVYGGGRMLGIIPASSPSAPGAPAPGTAPVPSGQSAADMAGVAPPIPGHVIPVVPEGGGGSNWLLDKAIALRHAAGGSAADIPIVGRDGLWYSGEGGLYQFTDCYGRPSGQPGYMSLEIKAWYAAGRQCDGTPFPQPSGGSAVDPAAIQAGVSTGVAVAGAAATAAGGASAGGTAAAVGGAIAAAAAALGPVPGAYRAPEWRTNRVLTFTVTRAARVLACNVYEAPGGHGWLAAALEVDAAAAKLVSFDAREGLEALYAEHGHRVLGCYLTEAEARRAAETFARVWTRVAPCPCPEIAVPG